MQWQLDPDARQEGGAVLIILTDETDVILVMSPGHVDQRWKFPGGGIEPGETPRVAACREALEEAWGGELDEKQLVHLTTIDQSSHLKFVFSVLLPNLDKIKKRGDEGELVGRFSLKELDKMVDFLEAHRKIIQDLATKKAA